MPVRKHFARAFAGLRPRKAVLGLLVLMEKDVLRQCPGRNAIYVCQQIWAIEHGAKDKVSQAG
jgi:hypothetical protein